MSRSAVLPRRAPMPFAAARVLAAAPTARRRMAAWLAPPVAELRAHRFEPVVSLATGQPSLHELLITLFPFMTAPVSAHLPVTAALRLDRGVRWPPPETIQ